MLSADRSLQSRKLTTEVTQDRQLSTPERVLARIQQDIMSVTDGISFKRFEEKSLDIANVGSSRNGY